MRPLSEYARAALADWRKGARDLEAADRFIRAADEILDALVKLGPDAPPVAPDAPTLRDRFAMAALTALAGDYVRSDVGRYATIAYEYADAMLAARAPAPAPPPTGKGHVCVNDNYELGSGIRCPICEVGK